jgi:hypothetical protein
VAAPNALSRLEPSAAPRVSARRRAFYQARFWLAIVLVLLGLLFWTRGGFAIPPNTVAAGPLPLLLTMSASAAYASVGLLLALRRPEVRIGAIEAWVGVFLALLTLAWGYLAMESQVGFGSDVGQWVALAAAVLVTPSIAALAVGLVLLYPTDHLVSARWRAAAWVAICGVILAGVGRLLRPGELTFVGNYQNPVGVSALGLLPAVLQVGGYVLLGAAAVLSAASLVVRYLHSDPVERAQLRIFAALTTAGMIAFVIFVITFFFPNMDPGVRDAIVVVNIVLVALGPIALTVAIARYRLWEIDRLVERTFVYGALTAILAGLYAATIRLLEAVFIGVTGQSSDAVLIIATLALATTFTPVKNRLEHLAEAWTHERARALGIDPPPGDDADAAEVSRVAAADPQLVALIDARIRAILDERARDDG